MGGRGGGSKPKFGEGEVPYFFFKLKVNRVNPTDGSIRSQILKTGQYGEIGSTAFDVDNWGTKRWFVPLTVLGKVNYSYIYQANDHLLNPFDDIVNIEVFDIFLYLIHNSKTNTLKYIDQDAPNK